MSTRHRLYISLSLLLVVIIIGSIGFHLIEGWNWFDGFYMT